ncbi:hypothetical protein, partial [Bacillus pumilus]|uniref:hypothetical protein n=1 Tax=Bacillus pumilus TaxID=1408 RepID=UPI003B680B6B
SVAKEYGLHIALSDEKVYGKGAKPAIPPEDELKGHLGRKAAAISALHDLTFEALEKNDQHELYEDL